MKRMPTFINLPMIAICSVLVGTLHAKPFELKIAGTLEYYNGVTDPYNFNGAQAEIIYTADTTDTPVSSWSDPTVTHSRFSVEMIMNITNRPNSAADLLGAKPTSYNQLANIYVANTFSPSSDNDYLWTGYEHLETDDYISLYPRLSIGFGSQDIITGTGAVSDLSFFTSPELALTLDKFELYEGTYYGFPYYLYNWTISNSAAVTTVPVPGAILLTTLGSTLAYSLRKQRNLK